MLFDKQIANIDAKTQRQRQQRELQRQEYDRLDSMPVDIDEQAEEFQDARDRYRQKYLTP